MLRPGELQEVSVSVVIPPGGLGEVLRALGAEEHDKFQVLYAGIDEAAYWVVTGQGGEGSSNGQQQHHQQQQRLDRVWAKLDKRMVLERRLDVEFSRAPPQQHQQPSSSSLAPSASVSSGPMTVCMCIVYCVRQKILRCLSPCADNTDPLFVYRWPSTGSATTTSSPSRYGAGMLCLNPHIGGEYAPPHRFRFMHRPRYDNRWA